MSLATFIRRMTEAGAPREAIAIAVEEVEALQTSLDARRAADRDRKRSQREREKFANVTGHSWDMSRNVTGQRVPSDKEASPIPPEEINSLPRESAPARAHVRGWHRLPDDWRPKPLAPQVQAKVDQWPPGALAGEIEKFRDWAANAADQPGRGRKRDWDRAFWNWLRTADEDRYGKRTKNRGVNAAAFDLLTGASDEPF